MRCLPIKCTDAAKNLYFHTNYHFKAIFELKIARMVVTLETGHTAFISGLMPTCSDSARIPFCMSVCEVQTLKLMSTLRSQKSPFTPMIHKLQQAAVSQEKARHALCLNGKLAVKRHHLLTFLMSVKLLLYTFHVCTYIRCQNYTISGRSSITSLRNFICLHPRRKSGREGMKDKIQL